MDHTRNPDRVFRRGAWAITLAGVLSIPLLLPDGNVSRRAMSWCSWRLASFSSRCLRRGDVAYSATTH